MVCDVCRERKAVIVRSRTRQRVCKECFFELFENEVHEFIVSSRMFNKGETVGVGVSGGKDSTVLIHLLDKLNKKHNYELNLVMLCVDEGIKGYRNKSIESVEKNCDMLGLPLKKIGYDDLFGITMDEVVKKIGLRGNCSYCGVFRRQALEKLAQGASSHCIVTGHNADDVAETVILNLIRGDISRFTRCTSSRTDLQSSDESGIVSLPRCKPFKFTYQKDIVLYAYFKKLIYFSVECTYAPNASRGDARSFIKEAERIDHRIISDIIRGAEVYHVKLESTKASVCQFCSSPTSSDNKVCSACRLMQQLNQIKYA